MFSRLKLKCLLEQFQLQKVVRRGYSQAIANTFSLILLFHIRNKTATEKIHGACQRRKLDWKLAAQKILKSNFMAIFCFLCTFSSVSCESSFLYTLLFFIFSRNKKSKSPPTVHCIKIATNKFILKNCFTVLCAQKYSFPESCYF